MDFWIFFLPRYSQSARQTGLDCCPRPLYHCMKYTHAISDCSQIDEAVRSSVRTCRPNFVAWPVRSLLKVLETCEQIQHETMVLQFRSERLDCDPCLHHSCSTTRNTSRSKEQLVFQKNIFLLSVRVLLQSIIWLRGRKSSTMYAGYACIYI